MGAYILSLLLAAPGPIMLQPGSRQAGEVVLTEGFESTGDYDTACAGPAMRYDFDGAMGCPYTTDAAPAGIMLHPPDNFPGGTQTAAPLVLRGGIDEKTVTIDDYTQGVNGDTTIAAIALGSAASANCTATWGSGWCNSGCTSNALTATNLATVLDACTGIDASATSNVVRISIDPTEGKVRTVTLSRSRAALNTVANGTDAPVMIAEAGSTALPGLRGSDSDTGITMNADGAIYFVRNGTTYVQVNGAGLRAADGAFYYVGTGEDAGLGYNSNQTPDAAYFGVSTDSELLLVAQLADAAVDRAIPDQTHPGVGIATSNSTATEWRVRNAAGSHGQLFKALADGAATSIVRIPVASNTGAAGTLHYTVYAADATNHQIRSGRSIFSVVNEAGTETCVLGTLEEIDNTPSGTLTAALTCDTSPTNAADLQLNAASSLTETTLRAYYWVDTAGLNTEPLPQ